MEKNVTFFWVSKSSMKSWTPKNLWVLFSQAPKKKTRPPRRKGGGNPFGSQARAGIFLFKKLALMTSGLMVVFFCLNRCWFGGGQLGW